MSPNCIVMPDKEGSDDKKSTKSVVNKKQKQMLNQEYIPETQQKKVMSSGQGLTNYQSIAQRQQAQKQIEDASKQRITNTTTTTGADGNIKSMEVGDGGSVANFHANAINKLSPMAGAKLQMDAGGLVPNLGKFMQDAGKGNNITDDEALKINQDVPGTDAYRLKTMSMIVNKNTRREEYIPEEEYDRYRDRILMRGGDHRSKETKERSYTPSEQPKGQTAAQKAAKGKSALELVKANITKKYGKGAIMDVKKKSKKKANEELDLTKIAEVFGGCIIENIKDPKFFNQKTEKKFQGSVEGKRLSKIARKTAKSLRSGFDTVELENPEDKAKQTKLDQEANKRVKTGKKQSTTAFTNEPLDDVNIPKEVRDPKTGETLTKDYADTEAETEKKRKEVKQSAYSKPETARKGERIVDQDKFSTRTGIIGRGGVEVTTGKGDGRKAGRTPEERKTGEVTYKTFVNKPEVKVTQSDREGDNFSASGEKDRTVRGNVTGDVDAKDSGETVTYRTRKPRSDKGKSRKKEVTKPEETKPETPETPETKEIIKTTNTSKTFDTSPNVNVQTNTSSQQGTGEFNKIMQQNKIKSAKGTGKPPELPNTSGYPADSDENLERAYKDFRKDYKKDMSMGDRFRRAVDVVDPSVPKAGKPSLVTALGAFATKQAAPSIAGAEAGALLARGDKKGALAAGLQAMQPGLGIGTIAGLVSMSRMLRGTQNKIPTKDLAKAASQPLRSFPGVYIPSMDDMSGKKRTQTQTQADMGGGDRGEMELAGLGAFALPKFRGALNRVRPPVVRGGTVGRRSAPS